MTFEAGVERVAVEHCTYSAAICINQRKTYVHYLDLDKCYLSFVLFVFLTTQTLDDQEHAAKTLQKHAQAHKCRAMS